MSRSTFPMDFLSGISSWKFDRSVCRIACGKHVPTSFAIQVPGQLRVTELKYIDSIPILGLEKTEELYSSAILWFKPDDNDKKRIYYLASCRDWDELASQLEDPKHGVERLYCSEMIRERECKEPPVYLVEFVPAPMMQTYTWAEDYRRGMGMLY